MSDVFLSDDEVSYLTNSDQRACQIRRLKKMHIPFQQNGERVIVLRHWAERAPFESLQAKGGVATQENEIKIGNFGG